MTISQQGSLKEHNEELTDMNQFSIQKNKKDD